MQYELVFYYGTGGLSGLRALRRLRINRLHSLGAPAGVRNRVRGDHRVRIRAEPAEENGLKEQVEMLKGLLSQGRAQE